MCIRYSLLTLAACEPAVATLPGDGQTPPGTSETPPGTSDTPTPPAPTPPTVTGGVGISGLTATLHETYGSVVVVTWTQDAAASVHFEFSVDDGVWLTSPVRALEAGEHQEHLYGVPLDMDVTWRLVVSGGDAPSATADQVIRTGPLPPGLPVVTVEVSDPAGWDADGAPYLFTTLATPVWGDPFWVLILDRQARTVWAERSAFKHISMHSRVARDGRSLLIDQNSFWATFDLEDAWVDQKTLDGTLLHSFATPGAHHPFTDMPDGSIAYGLLTGWYSPEVINVVKQDGTVTTLWECDDWMDSVGFFGICTSNTLNYDEATDRFLFSFYSLDAIVEIDGTSGVATRWFGDVEGAYAFDPHDSQFWWQHGGVMTPDGTLLTSSDLAPAGIETIVREYEIDDANKTLREVWSFGVGDGIYGEEMGEAVRLPNGNTWHNYGALARLRETKPDGTVVWDLEWVSDAIGRTMPIADLYSLGGERY